MAVEEGAEAVEEGAGGGTPAEEEEGRADSRGDGEG